MVILAAEAITTAAIAAGALVLGGLLTTVGTIITARSKVAELEVTHRQKLQDAHLQAARQHTDAIYIPLNAALSELASAFLVLREQTANDSGNTLQEALDAFQAASATFLESVRTITGEGKDAFLTADLDARLRDFSAFLRASRTATTVSGKVVIQTFLPLIEAATTATLSASGLGFPLAKAIGRVGVSAFGFGAAIEVDEVLAAPPTSRGFEERFQRDMSAMKGSIRDVTLGAAAH